MPVFSYQAVDSGGRTKRGVIEAQSPAGARRALREKSLLPVSVAASRRSAADREAADERRSPIGLIVRWRQSSVSSRDLSTATRQLSTLIGSDVRIEESLRLLAAQGDSPAMAETLLDVRANVLEGSSFARALSRHPRVFPDFYVASIYAGEQSSRLPEVLVYLAEFVEARHAASRKLKLALLYPTLLASISALMMTLMMIYVVPDIAEVFVSRGADLPLLTRLLIATSQFLTSYGLLLLALLAVAAFLGARQFSRPEVRLGFDRMLATRRPFARFSRQINAARFAATLATLVQSAVPLLEALNASSAVIPNHYIRSCTEAAAEQVREGGSVNRAIADAQVFPSMLVAIVASGEASRNLGNALERAARELDREVEEQLAVMVSLVEPMVLLAMGGMVLLMVMAILMPIIGLNDLALS